MKEDGLFAEFYAIVKQIPRGRVATYGQIAACSGNPRRARLVGYALHVNPRPGVIPCHRVVNKEGRVSSAFAFGGENTQIALLRQEGVTVSDNGYVSLAEFQWKTAQKDG